MATQNQSAFTWIGIDAAGIKVSGKLFSETRNTVCAKLENSHITVLSIKKINPLFSLSMTKKFTVKERLDFTHQLRLLMQAGVPLTEALSLIANTASHPIYQNTVNRIKEKIIAGTCFSAALSQFPEYFDTTYCKMIAVGEQSGQLEMILEQLIENQENHQQIHGKITKALFYPISVTFIAMAITAGLLIFVIPQFRAIYDNFGAQLPMTTRLLIAMSDYLQKNGLFLIMFITPIILLTNYFFKKNDRLKNPLRHLIFKIPMVKSILITGQIARWSQLLSMSLSSGIPLIDALQITNQAISQTLLQTQLCKVRESVMTGKSFQSALKP